MSTTTTTLKLPVQGDGTALENAQGTSVFDLLKVEADRGATVMYVPDPDNPDSNTIFWVQGVQGPSVGVLPEGDVTLTLTWGEM